MLPPLASRLEPSASVSPPKLAVPALRLSVPPVKVAIWPMRDGARAVQRQVRFLHRGQRLIADRAAVGHLEAGEVRLPGVAREWR